MDFVPICINFRERAAFAAVVSCSRLGGIRFLNPKPAINTEGAGDGECELLNEHPRQFGEDGDGYPETIGDQEQGEAPAGFTIVASQEVGT